MTVPVLPVYLVHWRASDWCRSSVASIQASEQLAVEITVINNGGDLKLPGGVRIVDPVANLGFAGAANMALREWLAGPSEWCVIGAHDLNVEPDSLARLLEVAAANPDFGMVGPLLHAPSGCRVGGERLGARPGLIETTWISGCCMLLRRRCIEQIGLFDERLGSYCEDIDLSYRARGARWHVGIADGAPAHGMGCAHPGRAAVLIEANWVLVIRKTYGWPAGARRLLRLVGSVPLDLLARRWQDAMGRLRAIPRAVRFLLLPL